MQTYDQYSLEFITLYLHKWGDKSTYWCYGDVKDSKMQIDR